MTIDEISKCAAVGKPSVGMTCPERCLYFELKDLYQEFKAGKIDKETGELRKREAVGRYEKDLEGLMSPKDLYDWHAKFWREIELAGSEYARNPSLEAADLFFKAVYKAGRKSGSG